MSVLYTTDFKELKRSGKSAISISVVSLIVSLIALGVSIMALIK